MERGRIQDVLESIEGGNQNKFGSNYQLSGGAGRFSIQHIDSSGGNLSNSASAASNFKRNKYMNRMRMQAGPGLEPEDVQRFSSFKQIAQNAGHFSQKSMQP